MATTMDELPRRNLVSRLLRWLHGHNGQATREVSAEIAAATRQLRCDRERADRSVEAWNRLEAEAQRGGHLAWEDLLSPPATECQEADRWT